MAVKSPALTAKASGQITARHPLGLALIEASTPILVEGDAGLPRVGRWLKRLGHGRVQRIAGDGGWHYRATGSSLLRGWRSLRPPSRWPSGTLSGGIGTPVDSGTLRKDRPAPAACVTTPLRLRVGPGPTLRFAGAKREPIADPWKALARGYLRPNLRTYETGIGGASGSGSGSGFAGGHCSKAAASRKADPDVASVYSTNWRAARSERRTVVGTASTKQNLPAVGRKVSCTRAGADYSSITRKISKSPSVTPAERASEGRQPSRFEKKTNTGTAYPVGERVSGASAGTRVAGRSRPRNGLHG